MGAFSQLIGFTGLLMNCHRRTGSSAVSECSHLCLFRKGWKTASVLLFGIKPRHSLQDQHSLFLIWLMFGIINKFQETHKCTDYLWEQQNKQQKQYGSFPAWPAHSKTTFYSHLEERWTNNISIFLFTSFAWITENIWSVLRSLEACQYLPIVF